MDIEISTEIKSQHVASNMNTILIKCELCEKNVNALDTVDLCRETDQCKEEFILCDGCFQTRTDTLRKEGWNVDDFITDYINAVPDTEEDIMDNELGTDFTFTQYLYSEEDVRQAIATNILLKNKEKTKFWIQELMQSQLTSILITLIWNIYITYYFPLNPEFYNYLLKQTNRMRTSDNTETINAITDITNNLMIRPFTADVLRDGMRIQNDDTNSSTQPTFFGYSDIPDIDIMDTHTVEHIITHIAGDQIKPTNRKKIATLFRNLDKLRKNPIKIAGGDTLIPIEIERAARTALIVAYSTKQKMGKAFFVPPSNIQPQDIHTHTHSADKTLQTQTTMRMSDELSFCAYNTPIHDGSTRIEGASDAMRRAFGQHWEYYAYRAPLWKHRIDEHRGTPDHDAKRILWEDDDLQEQFYQAYGYDPDEASTETVMRCIAINMRRLSAEEYCTLIENTQKKN